MPFESKVTKSKTPKKSNPKKTIVKKSVAKKSRAKKSRAKLEYKERVEVKDNNFKNAESFYINETMQELIKKWKVKKGKEVRDKNERIKKYNSKHPDNPKNLKPEQYKHTNERAQIMGALATYKANHPSVAVKGNGFQYKTDDTLRKAFTVNDESKLENIEKFGGSIGALNSIIDKLKK